MNMNLILDTNAFKYIYKYKNGEVVPDKIEGKKFNIEELCSIVMESNNNICITSQVLYELYYQSYKQNGNVNLFVSQYNFLKNSLKDRMQIWNDFDMYFNLTELKHDNEETYNLFISNKQIAEEEEMYSLVRHLMTVVACVIFEFTGDEVEHYKYVDSINIMFADLKLEIKTLYNCFYHKIKFYNKAIETNKEFENELDKLIFKFVKRHLNLINEHAKILNKSLEIDNELNNKENIGREYIVKVFNKIRSSRKANVKNVFLQELDKYTTLLKKVFKPIEIEFMKELFIDYIIDKRRIRKNDIIDSLMVSYVNFDAVVNCVTTIVDEQIIQNSVLITLDRYLYTFSEKYKYMYNSEIYKKILI